MKRRDFLATAALACAPRLSRGSPGAFPSSYYVGIAADQLDPYSATLRAIASLPAGEFPNVNGRPVVVKVNLVLDRDATTGTTTDPGVAKAVADICLENGATQVAIVEASQFSRWGPVPPPWSGCGYTSTFAGYSAVGLVDLDNDPAAQVPVPEGLVYSRIYLSRTLTSGNPVFISAAKLKTHVWTGVTLSVKNLFGLFLPDKYAVPGFVARGDPHLLSLNQSIVDINLARPADFAVIDGIWSMEADGPWNGAPRNSGVVLAGRNPVALDRVAMQVMGLTLPVPHLDFATFKGLGPGANGTAGINLTGDYCAPLNFIAPGVIWPYVVWPAPSPQAISLSAGQTTTIQVAIPDACIAQLQIIQHSDFMPHIKAVRTLGNAINCAAGTVISKVWDGRDDSGALVEPGLRYLARISGRRAGVSGAKATSFNFGAAPVTVDP